MAQSLPELSLLETRVLGTLYEKQHTVPDTYPLTLNAIVAGCNQKTSRSPVMETTETEVQAGIDSLKRLNLVMETSGGRVSRYSHNLERVLQVPSQSAAILASLMLRGPQTAGELRISTERLHKFADISAVLGFLQELAARPEGALVVELPRLPVRPDGDVRHVVVGVLVAAQQHLPRVAAVGGALDGAEGGGEDGARLRVYDDVPDDVEVVALGLEQLLDAGLRCEADLGPDRVGYKIRQASLQKLPYVIVVGEKEQEAGNVNVRSRAKGASANSLRSSSNAPT